MAEHSCTRLRVEYLESPLGLGVSAPRFSWRMDTTEPDVVQTGYEIEVREASSGLLLWGKERRDTGASVHIVYGGAPLTSNCVYDWRVRTWSSLGDEPSEWSGGRFETGLLQASDWQARWVEPVQVPTTVERWSLFDWVMGRQPEGSITDRLRPTQLLRQRFVLEAPVLRARLYATARGVYEAQVNGMPADDQVLAPGFDSYEQRTSVQCYDITAALRAGENILALTLADGWWAGRIGLTGSSAQWGDSTAAIWQLEIDYTNGDHAVFASDDTVRCAVGPHEYADLFIGERFDRRAIIEGWSAPGFDDSEWSAVTVLEDDLSMLASFYGEPVRRVADLQPINVSGNQDSGYIVDFGQVITGRVRLVMPQLPAGTMVSLEHTEVLDPQGAWFVNIEGINKEQTDVYIAAGLPGGEVYEPSFTFHGFRYVRITGLTAAPTNENVRGIVLGSDLETAGSIHTSDARLNKLHQNAVWSQRGNFLSIPTDCPQRERAGWSGDIQVFAPSATNNAHVAGFLTRWLHNLRADQLPDGRVPIYSPRSPFDRTQAQTGEGLGAIVAAAGWSDAIVIVPWVLYERYADQRVLEENYEAMLAWVDYQARTAASEVPAELKDASLNEQRRKNQALLYNTGDHFGDWLAPSTLLDRPFHEAIGIAPQLTSEIIAPMFQIRSLQLLGHIARVLGRPSEADAFDVRRSNIRAAFIDEYVKSDGRLTCDLQGPYVLALAFDVIPNELRASTAAHLARLIRENGNRLDTGFVSVPYLLDVLHDAGYKELATRILWQSESPSWLYEVDHGATTMWESWDAVAADGTARTVSMNHYAFGCVDDWLFRRVAGVEPVLPGYREFSVAPDFSVGLQDVQAHIDSLYGLIEIAWSRSESTATLELTVPPNTRAHIRIEGAEETLASGFHVRNIGLQDISLATRSGSLT
ncbi:family 78 glycoside hydrolase catalytic domain [Paenarthrobacter ilicis]|uniref:alpha-L-rhamnosidase n=1 Tax=Paenarthrobacter ilicis TaxID=43665 RepID=UPI00386A00C8